MSVTRDTLILHVAKNCLESIGPNLPSSISDMNGDILEMINDTIALNNAKWNDRGRKYQFVTVLPNDVIAEIIIHFRMVSNIQLIEDEEESCSCELAVYCDKGADEGIYVTRKSAIRNVMRQFNSSLTKWDFKQISEYLEDKLPPKELTMDMDLIPVNNGIFDYRLKRLLPFSPEMVFLSKCGVDYNPSARNVVIHNPDDGTDWDVDSWIDSLSDDPEIVRLLWEITGAVIRPNVPWNKSPWLYAESGNNGKGTFCRFLRNLCGKKSCAALKISQFSNDNYLARLYLASAVINDENDVKSYVDVVDKLKCAITGDAITIDRKYLSPLQFVFRGMVIQCFNEFPKVSDRTPSFLRRLLIIPMSSCFEGCERKYIKNDYVGRKEVLEYALYKVLNTNYYELSIPKACRDMLAEYNEYNNPVVEFWNEFRDEFKWDLLPYGFLYDVYKEWHNRYYSSGRVLGRSAFYKEIKTAAANDSDWEVKSNPVTPGTKMDIGEPIIGEYDLKGWQDNSYKGLDMNKKYRPNPPESTYRGLVRIIPTASGSGTTAEDEEERS